MDAALNRKSLMFGVPGIVLQQAGWIVPFAMGEKPELQSPITLAGAGVMFIGTALFFVGLVWYAKAKGHSGWWASTCLLSIVGLAVLACLPDRLRERTGPPH